MMRDAFLVLLFLRVFMPLLFKISDEVMK